VSLQAYSPFRAILEGPARYQRLRTYLQQTAFTTYCTRNVVTRGCSRLGNPGQCVFRQFPPMIGKAATSQSHVADVCRKWGKDDEQPVQILSSASSANRKLASRDALDSIQCLTPSSLRASQDVKLRRDKHVPHSICTLYPWYPLGKSGILTRLQIKTMGIE